jgi:NDP-4-keto-2,6-dideoxyhexose 3-C-methyltransferase
MITPITRCRLCGNHQLIEVINLGEQALTGIFPPSQQTIIPKAPLQLVKCDESHAYHACGLLQLKHTYSISALYGDHYGYRSGLNTSMVQHLTQKILNICKTISLEKNDIVIDIGSNDATSLKAYPTNHCRRIGIDPTAEKFIEFYTDDMIPIFDFFSADKVRTFIHNEKAKVITSFSMFYDLEDPLIFAKEVASLLHDEGIWVCEQSYMPAMLRNNAFDTICHEHLEYYALRQMQWIADHAELRILDVEFNEINGGSFSVVFALKNSSLPTNNKKIQAIIYQEWLMGFNTNTPYHSFDERIHQIKADITHFFNCIRADNKQIYGLGASTKGNVLLQYCNITTLDLPAIGEVNPDKFGCYTPGTMIPILTESDIFNRQPDYLFILPWHFKPFFETHFKHTMMQLVYPLPNLTLTYQG